MILFKFIGNTDITVKDPQYRYTFYSVNEIGVCRQYCFAAQLIWFRTSCRFGNLYIFPAPGSEYQLRRSPQYEVWSLPECY